MISGSGAHRIDGIAAQEDDLDAVRSAPVGHRKAQHIFVKTLHLGKIMHEDTDMAESEGWRFDHRASLTDNNPTAIGRRSAGRGGTNALRKTGAIGY